MLQLANNGKQGDTDLVGDLLPDELKNFESFDISAKFAIDTLTITLGTVELITKAWEKMK